MNEAGLKVYLDRLRPSLVPIAAPQPGVCKGCRSGANPGFDRCYVCDTGNVVEVLPISMSFHSGLLHRRLRGYKDGSKEERQRYTLELVALLYFFLKHHLGCIGGTPDAVVTVPSLDRDAVKDIVDRIAPLRERHIPLKCNESAGIRSFRASKKLREKRVLLLDDTFTSGKTITDAHRALTEVGANVALPVVIGRHFRPDFPTSRELTECLKQHRWKRKRCGICQPILCSDDFQQTRLV